MNKQNKKIKIVFGEASFAIGGIQRHLIEQMKYYNRKRYELFLITLFSAGNKETFYSKIPGDIQVFKLDFKNIYDFSSWIKLLKILKKIKPDIVLSSMYMPNKLFRFLKIFFGYKSIIKEDSIYDYKTKIHIITDRILSFFTYRIIAVSQKVADFTIKQEGISRDKFIVINNGVDIGEFKKFQQENDRKILRKELGFFMDDVIAVNVARISPVKNHKLMIDSFARVIKMRNYENYKLLIVGGGGNEDELRRYIQNNNLENNIIMVGYKKNVCRYYHIGDFFISTSHREGFSISEIEAMAFGLPLILTKTASSAELLRDGENGFLIKENSEYSVVEAIAKLHMSDIKKLSFNAYTLSQKFDIQRNVEKYEELFNECLK